MGRFLFLKLCWQQKVPEMKLQTDQELMRATMVREISVSGKITTILKGTILKEIYSGCYSPKGMDDGWGM